MSHLPHVDPLRLTPLAPSEPRSVSGVTSPGGSPSFNDHLERAGRPAQPQPAAAAPRDEIPSSRDAEVDKGRGDERSLSNRGQSDAGTAEGSNDERRAIDDNRVRADTENDAVDAEAELSAEDDELHLSEEAELVESRPRADAAERAHAAVAASGEITESDKARSAAAARRRRHTASIGESTNSHIPQNALDVDADPAEKLGVDVAKGAARLAAAKRRASDREARAGEGRITGDRAEEVNKIAPTATEIDGSVEADSTDRLAQTRLAADDTLAASSSQDGKPLEAANVTDRHPSATSVQTQPIDRQPDESGGRGAQHRASEDAKSSTSTSASGRRSISRPASRRHASESQSTQTTASAESSGASRGAAAGSVESVGIEADHPRETSGPQSRLFVDVTNESDRPSPQRNINSVGPRLGSTSPQMGERDGVDRARFVTRVAGAFQAAGREGGQVRLRLHPPELGVVRLEVKIEGGMLTARFEAETPSARTALLDNLPALRDRLHEQGIKIEKFNVDLMDRRSEDTPYGPPGGHDRRQEESSSEGNTSSQPLDPQDSPLEESSPDRPVAPGDANQLNVVI